MTKKKKTILIAIAFILLAAILFFVFIIYALTQAIGTSAIIISEQFIGEIAEGVVNGVVEGGKDFADNIISEGISSVLDR